MKCAEFSERLNHVLDQRCRPQWDAELRLHAETCAACRELADCYEALFEGFYALAAPEPSADLAVRVVDELRVRPARARRASLAAALAVATAAGLLLAVPLFQFRRPVENRNVPASHAAITATQSAGHASAGWSQIGALPVVGPVLVSMREGDDPYAELAKGTGQGLANVVLYMPAVGGSPGLISPEMIGATRTWPERVSEGFKPVTESVGETIDLLLDALPAADSPESS
jgi:hypothetical protein